MEGSELNSHIISLDKLDHNFISGINFNNNFSGGTVPLWSKTNYDDYYEFEIRASRIVEDKVSPTYKCQICNINVPKAYNKVHNNSAKHKTCLKIIDIALNRVQLFMTQNIEFIMPDANYNTYFCEPCAIEVPLKDKRNHEASKQHAKSTKHDNILKDLLIFYINDENSDEYIKAVNDYTNDEDFKVTETDLYGDSIEITALNGSKISVPFENYHGFFKVGTQIQCRVCKVMIEERHKTAHMLSEEHKNRIMAPIKNVHCIRRKDDIWSHCILCNDIIMDVQMHKLTSSHNDKLREAVLINTEHLQTSEANADANANGYICDVCDIFLPMGNVKSHLKGMKHKNNLKLKSAPKTEYCGSEKLQYLIKLNDKLESTCRVCYVTVDNIDEHAVTEDHVRTYNDFLETNTLIKLRDRILCKICDAFLMECYEIYHASGKKHVKLLKERNSKLKSIEPDESQVNSVEADSVSVLNNYNISPSTDKQSTSHSNKDLESNKTSNLTLASMSQSNNDASSSLELHQSNTSLETFKTTLSNGTLKPVFEPNINNMSKSNLTTLTSLTYKEIFESISGAFSEFNVALSKSVSESSYKTTEMEPSDNSLVSNGQNLDTMCNTNTSTIINSYFCETCKVRVPNNEPNINEHNKGNRHKNNVILKENLDKEIKTNTSISNINNSNNVSNISEHKTGIKHFFNVINNHDLSCKVCIILINNKWTDMDKHINSTCHKVNYNNLLKSNKVRHVDNKFKCDYCKVEITNLNEIDHIKGRQHAKNVTNSSVTENATVENKQNAVVKKVRVRGKKKTKNVSLNV